MKRQKVFAFLNAKKRVLIALFTIICYCMVNVMSYNANVAEAYSYYGSTGSEVISIQTKLKQWGYYTGSIDGIYGYQTYRAVRYFQSKNGLAVDGIAGSKTLAAMGIATTSSSNSNLNLLARAVHGEARGEPYEGQVAVAAVILNRVKNSQFPNTIAGVIYQSGAFSCVDDGQINATPNSTSIKAAQDALNGWDPSGGALYFYNPAKISSTNWIWRRPVIKVIGGHYFAK